MITLKIKRIVAAMCATFYAHVSMSAGAENAPEKKPTMPATTQVAKIDTAMKTPAQTIASIKMPVGFKLEVVANEPTIISPVCMAWDANGVMYVAEMRTYMLDINGSKSKEARSRVTRLESTRGDGVYDRVTVFADGLVLPRMILPLDDRILIRETDTEMVYWYKDTDGDGHADMREKWYASGGSGGNLEHQASHMTWNIDNWIYQTVDNVRFRFAGEKFEKQKIPYKTGQWGYAVDDAGRMIFSTAGAERPAHDFQWSIQYGKSGLSGELSDNFTEVFPLVKLADVQGGPGRVRAGGGLNRFTGTAGPSIYRGDAMPADFYGDLLIPEPVGRLIRRARVSMENGRLTLTNWKKGEEFIVSSDPNFRPVWSATGPDGAIYILDMYHGIIQEANWTNEGSYLRPKIQEVGLDKNINAGRIYRLTHESKTPAYARKPNMLSETPAQLVAHLNDVNGWWRDTAQKLIVLKGDKSVVPTLRTMAMNDANAITRLHALWTLDGLESADLELIRAKLKDDSADIRCAAIRISETWMLKKDSQAIEMISAMLKDKDTAVVIQASLSLMYCDVPQVKMLTKSAVDANAKNAHIAAAVKMYGDTLLSQQADKLKPKHLDGKFAMSYLKGKDMFAQACIACHGEDGKGAPAPEEDGTTLAPPLKGSKRLLADKSIPIQIAIHGLVGPHENDKMYVNEMAGFPWADDSMLAAILTYARNEWGNQAPGIESGDVARIRKDPEIMKRKKPFTFVEISELMSKLPPDKPAVKPETKPEVKKAESPGDKNKAPEAGKSTEVKKAMDKPAGDKPAGAKPTDETKKPS